MRWTMVVLLLLGAMPSATAQTPEQREVLAISATVFTAALTCPDGLDPDPTTMMAGLMSANGIAPEDVAPGGRYADDVRRTVAALAEEAKGKTAQEKCALLVAKYPRWIRPRTP